jgi:hypothetical protein
MSKPKLTLTFRPLTPIEKRRLRSLLGMHLRSLGREAEYEHMVEYLALVRGKRGRRSDDKYMLPGLELAVHTAMRERNMSRIDALIWILRIFYRGQIGPQLAVTFDRFVERLSKKLRKYEERDIKTLVPPSMPPEIADNLTLEGIDPYEDT